MKKLVFILLILSIIFLVYTFPAIGKGDQQGEELGFEVIPDDAIRLRILANSDSDRDQKVKRLVRDEVSAEITKWVEEINDIDKARDLLANRIPEIQEIIDKTLKEADEERDFTVEYNDSVSFPTKVYGNYLYPAGTYEAILITLGEGNGDNWWCVLFPPLCFLDFSNGISVAEASPETEEIVEEGLKIKFFLFEWLGWS